MDESLRLGVNCHFGRADAKGTRPMRLIGLGFWAVAPTLVWHLGPLRAVPSRAPLASSAAGSF
eukprot:1913076-Pyramimonas_sp.AAC.1